MTLDKMIINKEMTTVEAGEQLSAELGIEIRVDERLDLPGAFIVTDKTNNDMYFVPENGLQQVITDGNLSSLRSYKID